jgi:hypothetical protein
MKNIVYNKVTPSFASKIKNIVKVNTDIPSLSNIIKNKEEPFKNLTEEITIETKPIEIMYEKKNVKTNVLDLNNPFIKNLKNKKIIKYKSGGENKNKAFYQKKYEENSSNYNSISSNLKENIRATIDELKDAQQSFKIVKNKIMLNNASSDEEDHEEIQLD